MDLYSTFIVYHPNGTQDHTVLLTNNTIPACTL